MKKIIPFLILLALALPAAGFAQENTGIGGSNPASGIGGSNPATGGTDQAGSKPIATLPNPLGDKVTSIPDLFYKVINVIISLSYVVIAFFLLLSGFKFVAAQGSDEKLQDAKKTFYYTIIGALLIIGAQTIVEIVKGIISGLQ